MAEIPQGVPLADKSGIRLKTVACRNWVLMFAEGGFVAFCVALAITNRAPQLLIPTGPFILKWLRKWLRRIK